jgi:phage terminase small subunit
LPRERSPSREKAKEMYLSSKGQIKLKDIAAELGVLDTQIRKWKSTDKWENELKGTLPNKKRNVTNKKDNKNKEPKLEAVTDLENAELTDKQRLFCIYYIKTFNQTMAAIKAGYSPDSAHVEGSRLLRNAKVSAEIRKLKGKMTDELFLDAMDVLYKYIKIAFADITDFLAFGQKEVPVMTMFGPAKDEDGNDLTKIVNYVDFKESKVIDGSIISEVKQGKEGIALKLEDRMKALDKLALYFDLFPDKFKRKIEEEKLKIEKSKVSGGNGDADKEGIKEFIKATTMSEADIKELFKDDEDEQEKENS